MKKLLLILPTFCFIINLLAMDDPRYERLSRQAEDYYNRAEARDPSPYAEAMEDRSTGKEELYYEDESSDEEYYDEERMREELRELKYEKVDGCQYCPTRGCSLMGQPLSCKDVMSPFWHKVKKEYTQEQKNQLLRDRMSDRGGDAEYYRHHRCHWAAAVCAGADPNTQVNYFGKERALNATLHQDYELVKIFLEHDADPNLISWSNSCPLCYAKNKRLARLLVKHGANAKETKCSFNHTLIHHAMLHNLTGKADELVAYYLEQGIDPNKRDGFGYTTLHQLARWCAEYHFKSNPNMLRKTAQLLIDAGVSLNAKNNNGETAEDILVRKKKEELKRLERWQHDSSMKKHIEENIRSYDILLEILRKARFGDKEYSIS